MIYLICQWFISIYNNLNQDQFYYYYTGLPVTRAQPVPEATRVAWGTPATTTAYMQPLVPVPATLVQLWQRLDRQGPGLPNTAVCPCPTCPYITGAIMQRRYLLMVAFMNIERYLYGVWLYICYTLQYYILESKHLHRNPFIVQVHYIHIFINFLIFWFIDSLL